MASIPLHVFFDGKTRFGRLTLICEDMQARRANQRYAKCQCDCGTAKSINIYSLRNGISKSCGCMRNEMNIARSLTHGEAGANKTPEYRSWADAKSRCYNPNVRNFDQYGGRGIRMCERWRNSFEAFLEDMGRRPSPNHTLDRYPDNNGDYEPGNCRWATYSQQGRNKRTNSKMLIHGEETILSDAAEKHGINRATLARRIKKGVLPEDAVSQPIRKSARWHSV